MNTSSTFTMDDPIGVGGGGGGDLEETVEQLRARLDLMKRLVGGAGDDQQQHRRRRQGNGTATAAAAAAPPPRESIIDGKFLSVVFGVVLLLIVCVSSYAFLNLYYAILKKFPNRQHTEL